MLRPTSGVSGLHQLSEAPQLTRISASTELTRRTEVNSRTNRTELPSEQPRTDSPREPPSKRGPRAELSHRTAQDSLVQENSTRQNSYRTREEPPQNQSGDDTPIPSPLLSSLRILKGLKGGKEEEWRARRCLRGGVVVCALLENGGRGDACEAGFVGVKVVAVWWSCSAALLVVAIWWWRRVWSKITTAKEKRLSEDRSPSKSHIFPLYNGIGLTTH